MTDITKYKSLAIDHDCFKKIEYLTTTLAPGLTLSRAQVIRVLVNEKYAYEAIDELDQFSIDDHNRKDN
jgi:hypothetical protein